MVNLNKYYGKHVLDECERVINRTERVCKSLEDKKKDENTIEIKFTKDYSKNFNIKFYGLIKLKIIYKGGKVVEISKKKGNINYLRAIELFKKEHQIETDDVITIVDMYFANEFSKEYIGKGIFDK